MNEELRDEVAGVLGRVRPPEDHSPNCSDAEPCHYCTDLAAALVPLLERREREAWRTSRLDLAHELRESGAWSEVRMAEWVEMRADRAALTNADASTEETA